MKLLEPAEETEHRLDAIGYGFFTPFFFILTGVNLDIPSLMRSPKTLLLIPLFAVSLLKCLDEEQRLGNKNGELKLCFLISSNNLKD